MRRMIQVVAIALALFFTSESYAGNVSKAKEFMKADMYPQAIALLEKEIYGNEQSKTPGNPTNAEAHFLLGACFVHQDSFIRADERFASAVKLSADYGYRIGSVYKDAGQELLAKGNLAGADELFKKALIYEPGLGKQIAAILFETGKRYNNDRILFMAASYNQELKAQIAEHYHALSKSVEGDEAKIDLLGKSVEFDNIYIVEYQENRQALGSFHLEKAKEFAKRPEKEQVAAEHKRLAKKYLGDAVIEKELPEEIVYQPGTYTFSIKAGEQTPHWITFPSGAISNWNLDSADGKFQAIYYDGEIVNLWSATSLPKNKYKFKLLAVTDQPNISMVVRQR